MMARDNNDDVGILMMVKMVTNLTSDHLTSLVIRELDDNVVVMMTMQGY